MGFDITAYSTNKKEVAYHRAYMGGFRMMREQGYDWFLLIDASECDAGVSGNGDEKNIKLIDLKVAIRILENHKPTNLANSGFNNEQDRDEFSYRKPILKDFMEKCIKWCEENKKDSILIYFG